MFLYDRSVECGGQMALRSLLMELNGDSMSPIFTLIGTGLRNQKEHNWDSRQTLEVTEYSTQTQRAALAVYNLEPLSTSYDVFIVIKGKKSLTQQRNQ